MATDRSQGTPEIDESATTTSQLPSEAPGSDATVTSQLPPTSPPTAGPIGGTPGSATPSGADPSTSTTPLPGGLAPFAPASSAPPSAVPGSAASAVVPSPGAPSPSSPDIATLPPPAAGTAVAVVPAGAATAPATSPPGPSGKLGAATDLGADAEPPTGPPARHRPDAAAGRAGPTAPPAAPAAAPLASPPVQAVTPGPGWGWRALVAFLAGGFLTGAGFGIAQLDRDGDAPGDGAAIEATSVTTTSVAEAPVTTPAPPPPPASGAEAAAFVADSLGPSVVQVETNIGIGSGVIYDDGLILTNHHVIEGASRVRIQLKDGRRLDAEVLGSEQNVDIAVVSVGPGKELPIAPLAVGEELRVGQIAIAIGSPFSLQQTVTEGIVSAVNRPVPTGGVYTAMIQTDAPINPGNSGGALADREGRVIGINTAIQTDGTSNTNAGIGFAIPIDTAVSVADRIVAGIPIEAGFLGVAGGQSIDGAAGVQVTSITEGSAAEESGLLVGDLILSIDGAPVTAFEELAGLVVARAPGDVIELEVVRNGEPLTVEATLGARED